MPLDGARFEARVDRSGVHHIWLGARTRGGGGQVRVDGKLLTAARAAWEIENGSVPDGVRVRSCASEAACVRVDHLRLDQRAISSASLSKKRSPRGAGTIAAISPGVWKIGVTAGVDRLGQRRRTFRTIYGTRKDAATALAVGRSGLLSDRGDSDVGVTRGETREVAGVMSEHHSSTEPDCCRHDERVDGQFAAGVRRGEQVTGNASGARPGGHDLGEATRQDRIDGGVGATTPV